MKDSRTQRRTLLLALTIILQGGCTVLEPQPDRARFYVLRPMNDPVTAPAALPFTIGLGPIDVPAYLDRPQLVRKLGPNRVDILEYERWAESLRVGFSNALAHDLGLLLGPHGVVTYPWPVTMKVEFEVQVDLQGLELLKDGSGQLAARWAVKDGTSKQLLQAHDSAITKPAAGSGVEDSVAALSAAVAELSSAIADSLHELRARRQDAPPSPSQRKK